MSTFPQNLIPQAVTVREEFPASRTQTRSGKIQTVYYGSHFFWIDAVWPAMSVRDHNQLMAFVAEMEGIHGRFDFVLPNLEPRGTAMGAPVINTAHSKGDQTVKTRNWAPRSRVFLRGDLARIRGKCYRLITREQSNANGQVTLDIRPGLLQDVSDGEPITVRGLAIRVHIQDVAIETRVRPASVEGGVVYQTNLTMREDPD